MDQYIFGIDLGGTTVKLGLFTTEGILLYATTRLHCR